MQKLGVYSGLLGERWRIICFGEASLRKRRNVCQRFGEKSNRYENENYSVFTFC
jgi:hypothetical protein